MGISKRIKKEEIFTCDNCNKIERDIKEQKIWYRIKGSKKPQLRTYELEGRVKNFETFHTPNKVEYSLCSLKCAREFLYVDVELFLAEIKPILEPARHSKITPQIS